MSIVSLRNRKNTMLCVKWYRTWNRALNHAYSSRHRPRVQPSASKNIACCERNCYINIVVVSRHAAILLEVTNGTCIVVRNMDSSLQGSVCVFSVAVVNDKLQSRTSIPPQHQKQPFPPTRTNPTNLRFRVLTVRTLLYAQTKNPPS